jgi:HEAT repeat protein
MVAFGARATYNLPAGAAGRNNLAKEDPMLTNCTRAYIIIVMLFSTAVPCLAQTADDAAAGYLMRIAGESPSALTMLATLRQVGGAELVPLYMAACNSADRNFRLLGTMALGEYTTPEAVAALLTRIEADSTSAIRQQALGRLIDSGAITHDQLKVLLETGDEGLQSLAARALSMEGQGAAAVMHLRKLAASNDPLTSCLAMMNLLALGNEDQLPALEAVVDQPGTKSEVLEMICLQTMEQKILPAQRLLEKISTPAFPMQLRLTAYKALAELSPAGAAVVAEALRESDQVVPRMLMLRMLVLSRHGGPHVENIAKQNDVIGEAARFEALRHSPEAATAAMKLLAAEHPIVVGHLLDRISTSGPDGSPPGDVFVPVLVEIIERTPPGDGPLTQEHEHAAWAARILADMNTPASLSVLEGLLNTGGYTPSRRASVAGLLQTRNQKAVDLAMPLLESPYEELAITAALAMARHGDARCRKNLLGILQSPDRHRMTIPILAAWYLLRLDGRSKDVANQLAGLIK